VAGAARPETPANWRHSTIIAFILGIAGILGTLAVIPVISGIAFRLVVAGWALLLIATVTRELWFGSRERLYVGPGARATDVWPAAHR
jgi:hypothetical protein